MGNVNRIVLIGVLLFLACSLGSAQKKYTISGVIRDKDNTEALVGASVFCSNQLIGTTSNNFGFYSLTAGSGEIELHFSYVGYQSLSFRFHLNKDTVLPIELQAGALLQETLISSKRPNQQQEQTQMSAIHLSMPQVKSLPLFLGEVDLLKIFQLLPGVQSGGEGSTGLYVRGGGADQNLILLDGVPVYNASHLFGFFSVFNADAINSVDMLKGGFPARYGGRASSVIDIHMKEGNNKEFHGEGSIGFISAKLTMEGPLWKDRTSFLVSARRTYADLFTQPILDKINEDSDNKVNSGYYFYDLTAKINHRFSYKDQVYLSTYLGDDKFHLSDLYISPYNQSEYESKSRLKWGNVTSILRWNHIYTSKLFANTSLLFSKYQFKTAHSNREEYEYNQQSYSSFYQMNYHSKIRDFGAKLAFDYLPTPAHHIRFGTQLTKHFFEPGVTSLHETINQLDTVVGASKVNSVEWSSYIEDDYLINDKWKANLGLHWSAFSVQGRLYQSLQPRVSLRYLVNQSTAVKASYAKMAQYIHLLTNSGISLPSDLWVPTTPSVRPQTAHQWVLGLSKNVQNTYELSVEGYYKTLRNAIEYKEGAAFFDLDAHWENKIVQGKGSSYGIEWYLEKKRGNFTGWLGYTLSWTHRKFKDLNEGKRFPYKYDRRHDLSLVGIYKLSKGVELSGTWVYGTGNAITIPVATFDAQNPFLPFPTDFEGKAYGEKNGYRMSPYHRLDLNISFNKKTRWGQSRWAIGVYNAYCRRNPYYIDVEITREFNSYTQEYKRSSKFTQYSLFPILPSVSYHFKF